jgi:multidrug efflux system membrane fusion protein
MNSVLRDMQRADGYGGSAMNARTFCTGLSCFFLMLAASTTSLSQERAKLPEVPVTRPVLREISDFEDFTGRTEAVATVQLRARVSGYLLRTPFQDGAQVKEGDVLFEIDERPYHAELDKASAAVAVAETRLKLTAATHKRAAAGHARNMVSQEELDKAVAEVAEAEAAVRLAKAGLEIARLNLEFTRVHATIGGQIGRRLVDPGNLVKADETNLAVIVSRDPVYVYFDIDERTLLSLWRSAGGGTAGKLSGQKLPVDVGLVAEEGFPHRGVIDFADNRVDANTGTLRLRAVLPNKQRLIAPGMFARVRLPVGAPHKAVLVPEQAILSDQGAKFVFVVEDHNKIAKRPVVSGTKLDDWREIKQGVSAQDRVVIGRQNELQPGTVVRPRQPETPSPKPAPSADNPEPPAASTGRRATGPGILVEAVYPGANAQVVSDSVRSPIEQQLSSLENIRTMRSRCANDGTYTLSVTFARGVDLKMKQVRVQNRAALATPMLPNEVKTSGVHVKQGTAGALLMVNLFSPNSQYDSLYLGNYADIQIKDELARLAGVGAVEVLGHSDYALRVWLDPEKLAARNVNAGEVVRALTEQQEHQEFDPDKFEALIVKADDAGRTVRLSDVARVELGVSRGQSQAFLDGKPVATLVVHATGEVRPQRVATALHERLAEIRTRFPQGLELDETFDFTANWSAPERPTTPDYLLFDVDMPASASLERTEQLLQRCQMLLHQLPAVAHTLTLPDNPFDLFGRGPCILVRLAHSEERKSSREDVVRTMRARLQEIKEATLRLRDLSGPGRFPRCSYPIDLALYGPENDRLRAWVTKLNERLGESGKMADAWVNPDSAPRPHRFVDVDRTKARALGVTMSEIFTTLQVHMDAYRVNDFHRFGRTRRVEVRGGASAGEQPKDIAKLTIRNARGQQVPLGALVAVRETQGPAALNFLDLWPMVEITANPASGVPVHEVRKLCETLAEEVRKELRLTAEYRLRWLE